MAPCLLVICSVCAKCTGHQLVPSEPILPPTTSTLHRPRHSSPNEADHRARGPREDGILWITAATCLAFHARTRQPALSANTSDQGRWGPWSQHISSECRGEPEWLVYWLWVVFPLPHVLSTKRYADQPAPEGRKVLEPNHVLPDFMSMRDPRDKISLQGGIRGANDLPKAVNHEPAWLQRVFWEFSVWFEKKS